MNFKHFWEQDGKYSTSKSWFVYVLWAGISMIAGMNNTRLKRKILIIIDFSNDFFPTYLQQWIAWFIHRIDINFRNVVFLLQTMSKVFHKRNLSKVYIFRLLIISNLFFRSVEEYDRKRDIAESRKKKEKESKKKKFRNNRRHHHRRESSSSRQQSAVAAVASAASAGPNSSTS